MRSSPSPTRFTIAVRWRPPTWVLAFASLAAVVLVPPEGRATAESLGTTTTAAVPTAYPHTGFRSGEADVVAGSVRWQRTFSTAATSCSSAKFETHGDRVHRSSTAFEASGHGWWINLHCPSAQRARVTVQLQQYFTDGSWRNRGVKGSATVYSGSGRGNRSTGRATCGTSSRTGWRSVIDVDLVGVNDPSGVGVTAPANINCRVR